MFCRNKIIEVKKKKKTIILKTFSYLCQHKLLNTPRILYCSICILVMIIPNHNEDICWSFFINMNHVWLLFQNKRDKNNRIKGDRIKKLR